MDLIRNELSDIKKNFGDERKTDFEELVNFSKEDSYKRRGLSCDFIKCWICQSTTNSFIHSAKRGGRGKTAATVKDEDFIEKLFVANLT